MSPSGPVPADRQRVSVDLSPSVSLLLEHISIITGQSRAAIISGVLLDALPDLVERADGLKKRHAELSGAKRK